MVSSSQACIISKSTMVTERVPGSYKTLRCPQSTGVTKNASQDLDSLFFQYLNQPFAVHPASRNTVTTAEHDRVRADSLIYCFLFSCYLISQRGNAGRGLRTWLCWGHQLFTVNCIRPCLCSLIRISLPGLHRIHWVRWFKDPLINEASTKRHCLSVGFVAHA